MSTYFLCGHDPLRDHGQIQDGFTARLPIKRVQVGQFYFGVGNVKWVIFRLALTFTTLSEARAILEAWLKDYNESRPHSTLKDQTPDEYARKFKELGPT
jgi:transposase InsO family protein